MRVLTVAMIALLAPLAGADAQIVAETPPPSQAAPVPETAAEANASAVPGPPVTRVERGLPGEPDTIVTIYPSNLEPPPPAAFRKTYPPCSETMQDGCRNPGSDDEPEPEQPGPSPAPPPEG